MKRDINDAFLRALKPPAEGRTEIWDIRVAGLVLRVTPTGTATWSVRARTHDGKKTRPKLGTWPAIGVKKAREEALAKLSAIQKGGDPVLEKKAAQASRKARATVATVADRLAEWQAQKVTDPVRPWSVRWAAEIERAMKRDVIPHIGKQPLTETTRHDWTGLVTRKRKAAPTMASILFRMMNAFLGHAEAQGWCAGLVLPRKGLALIAPPPEARARVLTDHELQRLWVASGEMRPKPRAFVRLLLLTAAREMEVADIAVGELDIPAARWKIPAARAKNGTAITLPLPAQALEELAGVWPASPAHPAPSWRLLGDIAGNGLRGFSKIKARLDEKSGVTGWRFHDLRRTARTAMTRLGVARDHAEAAINHVSGRSALERTYDRHDYAAEVIVALQVWQEHVGTIIAAMPSAEMIELPERRRA